MRSGTAVACAAEDARMTLAVVTYAPKIGSLGAGEEDVCTAVEFCLRTAAEAPAEFRQRVEIHRVVNRDENVGVLRTRFRS